ncbi:sensor histidine kinase regulating citrate/malate metabolism [Actinomadura hallensis]|uniref:histidine kinase n=1 Tax=Actinomadura hallensis TaxID=337895 RepID=A0A543IKF8_9ACTN|nr:sensor histidine kinase [Actinomadura hallensis]TQM71057.1 sensor histidine kinase regulating citrate/malate metabolism [Actinomadura hallensis]HLV75344.1 sensor histidine kinase [Vulgatibacteraceae bacterium]
MRRPAWTVPGRWSLAGQLLVLQAAIVGLLVAAGATIAYLDAGRSADEAAAQTVTAVAKSIADADNVRTAVASPDPSRLLQPYAERVRRDTGVDFITIMSPAGIRYTHPNPSRIGGRFVGNTGPALAGLTFTETYTGTLGPSVRTVTPVHDGGRIVALVAVGITVRVISAELRERLVAVAAVAVAVLVVGVGGSCLVAARLRRQTRGVAPGELREMFEYYEAILHTVREGLLLTDRSGRVVLCNDAARDLLDLKPPDPRGRHVGELGLSDELAATCVSREPRSDEIHVADTRVLVVNTKPVRSRDKAMGNVVTLRDHTELQALTGELDTVRGFAESLRSQAHEAANRLHTVVSLVELGRPEQAVEFATAELRTAQRLTDRVVGSVTEPVLAALLLGKSAEAAERGVDFVVADDTVLDGVPEPRDLVTILGNLIDNAVDAALAGAETRPPRVVVGARKEDGHLVLEVSDSGPGVDPAAVPEMFRRGWTTKTSGGPVGHGIGLALVGQAVRRRGGEVRVGHDDGAVFTVRLPLDAP